jgi:hypothetical protein
MSARPIVFASILGLAIGCVAGRYWIRAEGARLVSPAVVPKPAVSFPKKDEEAPQNISVLSKWVTANSSVLGKESLSDVDLPASVRWIQNQSAAERAGLFALLLDKLSSDFPQGIPQVLKLLSPGDTAPASLLRALNASSLAVPSASAELLCDPVFAEGSVWARFLVANRQPLWPFWESVAPALFPHAYKLGRIPEFWGWQGVVGRWLNAGSESLGLTPQSEGPASKALQALAGVKRALQGTPAENWLEQLSKTFAPPGTPEDLSEQEENLYGDTLAAYLCRNLNATNLSSLANSVSVSPLLPKITLAKANAELRAGTAPLDVAVAIPEAAVAAWTPADLKYVSSDLARSLVNPFAPIGPEIEAMQSLPVLALRQSIAENYFHEVCIRDAVGLSLWLRQSAPGEMRDHGALALVMELTNDPYAQAQWASQISDPALRRKAGGYIDSKSR